MRKLGLAVIAAAAILNTCPAGGAPMDYRIDSIPEGYALHAYDDVGVEGRQPHLQMVGDTYLWTFNTSDNNSEIRARSSAFSYDKLRFSYKNLNPRLSYALAMTYSTDHVYKRVQSLWADGVQLHEPVALPNGQSIRVIVKVPEEVTADGKMDLEIRIHGEVNATASIVELWANGPAPANSLYISSVWGLGSELIGRVVDLKYDPVDGADVSLVRPGSSKVLGRGKSRTGGWFKFGKDTLRDVKDGEELELVAISDERKATHAVDTGSLSFEPVRYRPIPAQTAGLKTNQVTLDGTWRISPKASDDLRSQSLSSAAWKNFQVPGQWRQQGFEIPQDQVAAVAREFEVPNEWAGQRVFLRFEAIHAGTNYWLNGKKLGYSENLFTPVEWEITEAVVPGKNRLYLEMKVDTISERLSVSSGYAFHNLGGIDRSVCIFALPKVNVKNLAVFTDLDAQYKDSDLRVEMVLDNPGSAAAKGLSVHAALTGPDGKSVKHSSPEIRIDSLASGSTDARLISRVSNPLKWSAEKPNLYKLALELRQDGKLLERIERNIGFRSVEVKGSELYVNGVVAKLAGACHHEVDPLMGRAGTAKHAEMDVELMKQANLNYIRTSHYPPVKELVDAADRLGMYLEVEAPFCWVGATDEVVHLREILTPTTAMVDYYNSHPSVIVWSIANESHLNEAFVISNGMVKQLDPSRPTTFNHPFSKEENEKHFDFTNRHYVPMPYDEVCKGDPHPLIFGEFFFPICHEQTDVMINPGLRELWGHGHSDPRSAYAQECQGSFVLPPLKPGTPPDAWEHILNSKRVTGGVIWASHDDSFYFSDGTHAGYSWHHGYWGLVDAWRRTKPEWWLSKMIFAPVWFPERQLAFKTGQQSVTVPVQNRYAFTDLSELDFTWEAGDKKGKAAISLPPNSKGEMSIALPVGVEAGGDLVIRVNDRRGRLVNAAALALGERRANPVPRPKAGAPQWTDDGRIVTIKGKDFTLVFDKQTGDLDPANGAHRAPILQFPSLHLTRYDFGDLAGPKAEPYEVLPNAGSRMVESVEINERREGLEIKVSDRYDGFAGSVTWLIDGDGTTSVTTNYEYNGHDTNIREFGMRTRLASECDTLSWRRWSEWGVFPEDSISRTAGKAKARRDGQVGPDKEGVPPNRPWSLDQTEMGTADFRGIKFHIYEASLADASGNGVRVVADANAHFRSSLAEDGVMMHVISRCRLGQYPMKAGDKINDTFTFQLTGR